jgi:hypothetical protein
MHREILARVPDGDLSDRKSCEDLVVVGDMSRPRHVLPLAKGSRVVSL